jgi:hypothetical protein
MPTTPPTFVAASELAAADLNLLRDGILELQVRADGTDYLAVQVARAANQTISTGTDTEISFDTQIFDLGGAWAAGTDIIIPSGWIPAGSTTIAARMFGTIKFATNSTGVRYLSFLRNGTVFGTTVLKAVASASTNVFFMEVDPDTEAADVFTVEVNQNSGGNLAMTASITLERAGVTG